ncbi:MAG: ABC transporter transmembrane domain-containing protein [Amphiplicatus sp.]
MSARGRIGTAGARLAELIVGSVAINILAIALPIFSMQIYDRVLPSRADATLVMLVAGVAVAVALETLLRITRARLLSENGARFERNLSCTAVRRVLGSNLNDMGIQSASEKLQKMQAVRSLREFHSGHSTTVFIDCVFILAYLALIYAIGGLIILAPLSIVALIIDRGVAGGARLRRMIDIRKAADAARYDFLVATLQSMGALKSFALGGFFARRYEPLEYRTSLANFEVSRTSAQILNAGAVLGNLMTAAVVTLGVTTAMTEGLSIGSLIACVLLSGRLIPPLQRGVILWMKYQEYSASRIEFLSILKGESFEPSAAPVAHETDVPPALEWRDLGIARRRTGPPLLRRSSAQFELGEMAVIRAGGERRGSLLLRVIAGLATVNEGEILVQGTPLRAIPLTRRADFIGYLSSSAELFNGTILENLTSFGLRDQRQALAIASRLGVDKDVARMANGWNTIISGKSSDEAPAGLRQRIAIARVLAARPPVILFDEAGELLDNRSYDLMVGALAQMRAESVMLLNTADENLIRFCNRELRLNEAGALSFFALQRRIAPSAAPGWGLA